ncbi:hypothetical protein SAMN06265360_11695 [Haloechinothrix alba]|uniref:Uncharacterized protein n=1 Tax=Haloechinothrix alba TaxID=664784 RepID=A0A238YRU1_9PSEU|nr:hypothetical protein [Haloechinothrix alba]SNR73323.1 hypothetical protein SAMN06265360_11695 [Haloechinothrix alba]
MPPSDGAHDELRIAVAPPDAVTGKSRRRGYLALAASGLLTATAFAGVADLAADGFHGAEAPQSIQEYERDKGDSDGGRDRVAGDASAEHTTDPIDDSVASETLRRQRSTESSVIITRPDGTTTISSTLPGTTGAGTSARSGGVPTTDEPTSSSSTETTSSTSSTSSTSETTSSTSETTTSESETTTSETETTTSESETTTSETETEGSGSGGEEGSGDGDSGEGDASTSAE